MIVYRYINVYLMERCTYLSYIAYVMHHIHYYGSGIYIFRELPPGK